MAHDRVNARTGAVAVDLCSSEEDDERVPAGVAEAFEVQEALPPRSSLQARSPERARERAESLPRVRGLVDASEELRKMRKRAKTTKAESSSSASFSISLPLLPPLPPCPSVSYSMQGGAAAMSTASSFGYSENEVAAAAAVHASLSSLSSSASAAAAAASDNMKIGGKHQHIRRGLEQYAKDQKLLWSDTSDSGNESCSAEGSTQPDDDEPKSKSGLDVSLSNSQLYYKAQRTVGQNLFEKVKRSLELLETPLDHFDKLKFSLLVPSNNSLSAQTVSRLRSWLQSERKQNEKFFRGIYDSEAEYDALDEDDLCNIYHNLPKDEQHMTQTFMGSEKVSQGNLAKALAKALHEKDREKYACIQNRSVERMHRIDQFVFKVNNAGGEQAYRGLLGKISKIMVCL